MVRATLSPPLLPHKALNCISIHKPLFIVSRTRWNKGMIRMQKDSSEKPGREPPETLFMRELKRRGLSSTTNNEILNDEDESRIQATVSAQRGALDETIQVDQRKQSMALNSEGLEGLIPRARALLTLGGSFFLAFGPLILSSITIFAALYFYYGPTFIHSGPRVEQSQQKYIDPYELLENEQIPSGVGPSFVPFNALVTCTKICI